jgi:hypothetical protein
LFENLTISSIAIKHFLKNFHKNSTIFKITKQTIETYIRNTYIGGIVQVYKPYGENLYHYDINSSYPHAMLNDMPCGEPIKLTSEELLKLNDTKNLKDFFGFVTVKIYVPYTYKPFLHVRNNAGFLSQPYGE